MKLFKTSTRTLVYNFAHTICRDLFEKFTTGEAYGVEYIPKKGPFILAGNHISFLDPPVMGANINRESYYFARSSLFKTKFSSWLLTNLNVIPVNRESKSDIKAMKGILKILRGGEGLVFFPEGTRSKDGQLQKAKSGVGLIACKTGVPVIPTRIFGANAVLGRDSSSYDFSQSISVQYGKPLLVGDYDPGKDDANRYQEASDRIMSAIAAIKKDNIPNY